MPGGSLSNLVQGHNLSSLLEKSTKKNDENPWKSTFATCMTLKGANYLLSLLRYDPASPYLKTLPEARQGMGMTLIEQVMH